MFILSVSENILFFICGFGILQGVLLASLVYFHTKSDKSVNIFLALYIIATSAIISLPFIMEIVGWQNSFFAQPVPLVTGPLLYLYLRSFKQKVTWTKALPHFIPFFLFFFFTYWNLSALSSKYPDAKDLPAEVLRSPATILIQIAKPVQQILYYFLARRTLISYQRSILHLFSETSLINMHWARFLINGYLILVCIFIAIFPLMLRYPQHFDLLLLINMAIGTPYIYMATLKGVMQHTIWQSRADITKETTEEVLQQAEELDMDAPTPEKPKTVKSGGLSVEKIDYLVERIQTLMDKDKLYQETELTLLQVANKLDVPAYQVSLAIKEGMQKNFYDLINGCRVEEAKKLLLDTSNRNFTILSVGFEAGFNSKTTFNTVFKKFTGLTPTEFRDKQKDVSLA